VAMRNAGTVLADQAPTSASRPTRSGSGPPRKQAAWRHPRRLRDCAPEQAVPRPSPVDIGVSSGWGSVDRFASLFAGTDALSREQPPKLTAFARFSAASQD